MNLRSIRTSLGLLAITLSALACSANPVDDPMPPPPPEVNGHMMMMWLPNRILDLCDIPRAGVDIGPGIGFDLSFTHYMRLAAMMRTSGGIGYETFRHPPVKFGHEEYFFPGGADMFTEAGLGDGWYQDTWDIRIEAHLLIVGAHACINLAEIGDFIVGFAFYDPRNDDY